MSYFIKSLVVALSLLLSTTVFAANTSYYGSKFHGKRTASGSIFNMNAMTAAHKTLPFGSRVKVTNNKTNESVIVNDSPDEDAVTACNGLGKIVATL